MRPARPAALAVLVVWALAACAPQGTRPGSGPPPSEPATSAVHTAVVPDVAGEKLDAARNLLARADLVPVVRYAPEILVNAGAVMLTVPKAGMNALTGDVVVLVVAGRPDSVFDGTPGAKALSDLAAEREDVFVGVGFAGGDARKPMVVALAPGADAPAWEDRLAAAAGTQKYTVRQCDHTRAELRQIQAQMLPADLVPHAQDIAFTTALRPAECAVHVTGALRPAEVAALEDRYGTALTVQATGG
jgi:PASTA domain